MRIPDDLIAEYLTVYTDVPLDEIEAIRARQEPMAAKLFLAHEIVKLYHGVTVADAEERWFRQTFSARHVPDDVPEITLERAEQSAFELVHRCLGPGPSNNELRRLFRQGAIHVNGATIERPEKVVTVRDGDVVQIGKRRWFRLRITTR